MIRRLIDRWAIWAAESQIRLSKALDRLAVKIAPPDSDVRKQEYWRAVKREHLERKLAQARSRLNEPRR
jgi:hypothetical protein